VIANDWVGSLSENSSIFTTNGQFPHAIDGFRSTFLNRKGKAPQAGEIFKNPDLGKTLQLIADGGCAAFYNGSIAEAIAAFSSVGGTHLTKADMSSHYSEWADPVNSTYRDRYTVFELPPNPQGIAALQMLNILEGYNLTAMGHNTADYLHVQIEAKKLAFADRAKYYADPDFVKVPVEGLISKAYANERRKLINMSAAANVVDAGTPAKHAEMMTGDTIYLTTADSNGMMVSLIQSNYEGFGSGLVVPGLGFALQDRGALFSLDAAAADVYAPGKRPFHTIIPGFVYKDEQPWLSFGVMGGNMQPQGHAQILSNIIDFGMNLHGAHFLTEICTRGMPFMIEFHAFAPLEALPCV
jgi:gamma-glutamyltranspeptidase/glutathione hydrolase